MLSHFRNSQKQRRECYRSDCFQRTEYYLNIKKESEIDRFTNPQRTRASCAVVLRWMTWPGNASCRWAPVCYINKKKIPFLRIHIWICITVSTWQRYLQEIGDGIWIDCIVCVQLYNLREQKESRRTTGTRWLWKRTATMVLSALLHWCHNRSGGRVVQNSGKAVLPA